MSSALSRVLTKVNGGENVEPATCVHPKRGRGKPTLYTTELSQLILQDIAQGVPKTKAFVANGISLQTGYDWERAHPEFAEAVRCAREKFRASWRCSHSRAGQGQRPSLLPPPNELISGKPCRERISQKLTKPGQTKATLTVVLPSKQLPGFAS